jgi:hypothetical protein
MKFIITLIFGYLIGYLINKAILKNKSNEVSTKEKLIDLTKRKVNILNVEKAKIRIKELGLPNLYVDILDKNKIHESLEYLCQFPNWLYSDENFVQAYSDILGNYDEIIPLCEEGDVTALVAVLTKGDNIQFIHMVYESPNSHKIYNSRQTLLVDLFETLWEEEDEKRSNTDLGQLKNIAKIMNFHHLKELNTILWANCYDYEKRRLAISQFQEKLDKK